VIKSYHVDNTIIMNHNRNLEFLNCLADIGMSEREARVYLALLNRGCATATDLQKISGVPQSKVYEIIDSLSRQGYCLERKVGRKKTFEVIDPVVTLTGHFEELQERLKKSINLKKELEELYTGCENASDPLEYIEVLHGNEIIHHHYCHLVNNTKEELLGFGRGPYACDTEGKSAQQDEEESGILKRGGIVRWVYEINLPDDEWIFRDLDPLCEKGVQIRVAKSLPIKMMIFDRQSLLVAEEEPLAQRGELTMSIIKQGTIVNAFRALFEFFWDHSTDLKKWKENEYYSLEDNSI